MRVIGNQPAVVRTFESKLVDLFQKLPVIDQVVELDAGTASAYDNLRRPPAGEVLAAVLLDRSGLRPGDLREGITVVRAPRDVHDCIVDLVKRLYSDLQPSGPHRWTTFDSRMIFDSDSYSQQKDAWVTHALQLGIPIVVVTEDGQDYKAKMALRLRTRIARVPDLDEGDVIALAIRVATGAHSVFAPRTFDGVTLPEYLAALVGEPSGEEAVERLGRIVDTRGQEDLLAPAEPLSAPVERVVKRLSEMSGFGEARAWGMRLANEIAEYRAGRLHWADLDKGILLSGPPGCGKTTFARALAAECGVTLFETTYTEWAGQKDNGGDTIAKALTRLFAEWRKAAASGPIIVFVDEIDSIGKRGLDWRSDYWYGPVINAWLAFLDGATPRTGIIVLAATNFVDRVDPAMTRPGRLERHVVLPKPTIADLPGIIAHHLGRGAEIDPDELREAARACRGMSPADVEMICREAHRIARPCKRAVCADDVTTALKAMRLGTRRHPAVDWHTCVHEAGHAVAAQVLGLVLRSVEVDGDTPHAMVRHDDHTVGALADWEARITTLLSARAAEEAVFGMVTGGSETDLREATGIAMLIHTKWGMGLFGLVSAGTDRMGFGDQVHDAIRETLDRCYDRALALIRRQRENVIRVAEALRERRYLDGEEVRALYRSPLRRLEIREEPDEGFTIAA